MTNTKKSYEVISQHVGFDLIQLNNGNIARVNHDANGVYTGGYIQKSGPGIYNITPNRFTKLYYDLVEDYTAENFCK